ncbi:MAG TPA: hypothetical protein VF865_16120, partial [Acidobacteriaceae bacterium]
MYVPLGVGLAVTPPPVLVAGISREAPHPATSITQHTSAIPPSRRNRLGLTPNNGNSAASQTICLSPGHSSVAPATLVAT